MKLVQQRTAAKTKTFGHSSVDITTDKEKYLVAIGDIHGCYDELVKLLRKVLTFCPIDRTILIFLGDLMDRGPKCRETLRLVYKLCNMHNNILAVQGNHDEKHFRFWKHRVHEAKDSKYKNPMKIKVGDTPHDIFDDTDDTKLNWLGQLPAYVKVNDKFVFTHAGIIPGRSLDEQPQKQMIRVRYVDKQTKKFMKLAQAYNNPNAVMWYECYCGSHHIIYGHHAESTKPTINNNTIGIDTGCVFGGKLTACIYNLETNHYDFESVDAQRVYFTRDNM